MSSGIYNQYTGYHNRRSIRLPGYDYTRPGYYFVTVCIHDRKQRLFGDIHELKCDSISAGVGSKLAPLFQQFTPNQYGQIVLSTWNDLPNHNHQIKLDEFIIMPAPTVALSEIIRQLKIFSAKRINTVRQTPGTPV